YVLFHFLLSLSCLAGCLQFNLSTISLLVQALSGSGHKKRHPRRGATLSGFTCYAIPSLLLPCRSISGKGFRRTFRLEPRRPGLQCPSLGGCCAVSFRIPRRESCRRWSCVVGG